MKMIRILLQKFQEHHPRGLSKESHSRVHRDSIIFQLLNARKKKSLSFFPLSKSLETVQQNLIFTLNVKKGAIKNLPNTGRIKLTTEISALLNILWCNCYVTGHGHYSLQPKKVHVKMNVSKVDNVSTIPTYISLAYTFTLWKITAASFQKVAKQARL